MVSLLFAVGGVDNDLRQCVRRMDEQLVDVSFDGFEAESLLARWVHQQQDVLLLPALSVDLRADATNPR